MSAVSLGASPASRLAKLFVLGTVAALLAFAYMAASAASDASARDWYVSDQPSQVGSTATPPAPVPGGSCGTPNRSIRLTGTGPATTGALTPANTSGTEIRNAIQDVVNAASSGDSILLCPLGTGFGTGYDLGKAGGGAGVGPATTGVDLGASGANNLTIASSTANPADVEVRAVENDGNAAGSKDVPVFVDTSSNGKTYTIKDLRFGQNIIAASAEVNDGGIIRISNVVSRGTLNLENVSLSTDVSINGNGGVVAAENVNLNGVSIGTDTGADPAACGAAGDQATAGLAGGAVYAKGTVNATDSSFTCNVAGTDGGAIAMETASSGSNRTVVGEVVLDGDPSTFDGNVAGDFGGAISANKVRVENSSRFGVRTPAPTGARDIGNQAEDGGAIAAKTATGTTAGVVSGYSCPALVAPAVGSPTTCRPGDVTVTGAAYFGGNVATVAGDGNGGAIFSQGSVNIDGSTAAVTFTRNLASAAAGPTNGTGGGGAIVIGGAFSGTPNACAAPSSVKNLTFTGNYSGSGGGGAVHILAAASSTGGAKCAVDLSNNTYTSNGVQTTAAAGQGGRGGAVRALGGSVTTSNSTFTSNRVGVTNGAAATPVTTVIGVEADGGAVSVTGGTDGVSVTDSGSTYTGNEAGRSAGAMVVEGANAVVRISDAEFSSNEASIAATAGVGGAMAVAGAAGSDVEITTSEFMSNEGVLGGAFAQSGNDGAVKISEVDFAENSVGAGTAGAGGGAPPATGNGGAIYLATSAAAGPPATDAELLIEKSAFMDNSAGTSFGWGGAIYQASGAPGKTIFNEVVFEENSALGTTDGDGGAIASNAAIAGVALDLDEVALLANTAQFNGGAIKSRGGPAVNVAFSVVQITNTVAEGNQARAGSGGVISAVNSSILNIGVFDPDEQTIEEDGLVAEGNMAGTNGGAISSTGAGVVVAGPPSTDVPNLALVGSVFTNNKNGQNLAGTGIGTAAANTGAQGGAVYFAPGAGAGATARRHLVLGSQFVGNESAKDGGAIYSKGSGALDIAADPAVYGGIGISAFAFNSAGKANTLANQPAVGGAIAFESGAATEQNLLSNLFVANSVTQTNTNALSQSLGGAIGSIDVPTVNSYRNTFTGNEVSSAAVSAPAPAAAGGVVYSGGANTVNLVNSTFSGNNSTGPASVVWNATGGNINLINSTISGNGSPLTGGSLLQTAAGGAGTIAMQNSIVSEGLGVNSSCVSLNKTNQGGNVLTEDTDCGGNAFVGTGGGPAAKVTPAALDLKPLANNGNSFSEDLPLTTMALGTGSVARSSSADCDLDELKFFSTGTGTPPLDERGLKRPDENCSSGAYQLTTVNVDLQKLGNGSGTVTSDPAGIDCGPGCASETVEFVVNPAQRTETNSSGLQPIVLTAAAASQSTFNGFGAQCQVLTATTCQVIPDGNKVVTANFSSTATTLTVARVGNGNGKVTSSPAGIDCGTTCVANFNPGQSVTLTAEPEGRSTFRGWSGACASAGTAATCTVTMDQSKTATAEFAQRGEVNIVRARTGVIRVPRNRVINVGRVECLNGTCQVTQATIRVRVRGVNYRANVRGASGSFSAGTTRTIQAVVPQRAFNGLRKGRKSGRVDVVIRAEATAGAVTTTKSKNFGNGLRR